MKGGFMRIVFYENDEASFMLSFSDVINQCPNGHGVLWAMTGIE
jgi:hypothetical protein